MNTHALQRLKDRVISNNIPLVEVDRILLRLEEIVDESKQDLAVKLYKFNKQQVSDLSNGDEVWAIIRDNDVKTIMLRRSTQPATCGALRVKRIVRI